MTEAPRRVRVTVPATSANLGPGFDTLGIALSVYDELTVSVVDEPGVRVVVSGVGEGEVPLDERNLVASSMLHTFAALGVPAPGGVLIEASNTIPHGRGMGSSGAAVVAGIMAAVGLVGSDRPVSDDELLRIATELEGHPDNVAPALFGGLTIAWITEDGPRFKRLLVHRGVSPLVLVPEVTMSTKLARSLQPEQVPHADAIFNLSRSALLVAAMTQSPELLLAATEDRLHQDYRAGAMPQTSGMVQALRERGFPAVVSGAGPSVLVLANGPGERERAAAAAAELSGVPWTALSLAVDIRGARVVDVNS
ncbi:homoserine kinase [Mycetocola reblochoni]|uniref:Homoserine kinase n=2 Tax=Mycetocola reblochoni TaxID=331618 RepID=A0A1R4JTF2_9MICO|nr:homoserine kinase [Mycetocola reblochoni]RLP70396.1 homoserine kinase [Mycetocola reblochoni]SJN35307.1 Homoserine kinase [Mycetocola reblochoni REB411]